MKRLNILHYIQSAIAELHSVKSYSQEGEDIILNRIFDGKKNGFYIDVGAHHPKRFSTTYLFYKNKWRGINIDAMPHSMDIFHTLRPRDINIECAVASTSEPIRFFIFNETALNTCVESVARERDGGKYHIVKEISIIPKRLDEILNQYIPASQTIDFLTVDVEGKDLDVLQSNNWDKYRPKYVLIETMEMSRGVKMIDDSIYKFLIGRGYEFYAKTVFTLFFRDKLQ